jgi:RNA polymerase sigma factor (sigma-70 family)
MSYPEPIPPTLIAQARADRRAMNECCDRLQGVIRSLAAERCRRFRGDYDDTFSLGMEAAMTALSSYDGSVPFIAYLYICVRRKWRWAQAYREADRRHPARIDKSYRVDEIIDLRERLARECTAAQVREILDKMPPDLANTIRMVYGIGVDRMGVVKAAEASGLGRRQLGRRLRKAEMLFSKLWEPPTEGG